MVPSSRNGLPGVVTGGLPLGAVAAIRGDLVVAAKRSPDSSVGLLVPATNIALYRTRSCPHVALSVAGSANEQIINSRLWREAQRPMECLRGEQAPRSKGPVRLLRRRNSWTKGIQGLTNSSRWKVWGREWPQIRGQGLVGGITYNAPLYPPFCSHYFIYGLGAFEIDNKHPQRWGWW